MSDEVLVSAFLIFAVGLVLGVVLTLIAVSTYRSYSHPSRRHERERRNDEIRIRQWTPSKPLPPTPRGETPIGTAQRVERRA